MAHLYACQLLSTYQISRITGDNRQRVNWVLQKAGVPVNPRGTGRPRAGRDDQARHLDDLYLRLRLSNTQIAGRVGIPAPAVRYRLLARGVPMRTRGGNNREDRIAVPQDELAHLYVQAGLSAEEVTRQQAFCLSAQELPRGRIQAARSGPVPAGAEDPADSRLTDPVAEPGQLTMHPAVSPPRVLRRQSQCQVADLPARPWAARPVRVRPFPGHQTMPLLD
jgi:hypothetical protein